MKIKTVEQDETVIVQLIDELSFASEEITRVRGISITNTSGDDLEDCINCGYLPK